MPPLAYVDTSCLVAVALAEPAAGAVQAEIGRCTHLFAADLLEAELRATLAREQVDDEGDTLLGELTWVRPPRRLTQEIGRALSAGFLRGADVWHVACALFLSPNTSELTFLTLDEPQGRIARALGFDVPHTLLPRDVADAPPEGADLEEPDGGELSDDAGEPIAGSNVDEP